MYISEISPASRRGETVAWTELAVNIGVVYGYAAGLLFSGLAESDRWRAMLALGMVPAVVMIFLAVFVLHESPRFLVLKGRDRRARLILKEIYPPGKFLCILSPTVSQLFIHLSFSLQTLYS